VTLPTWITLSRLLGVPLVLWLLIDPTPWHRWASEIAFLLAAGTDWLDGYLARRLDCVTELGKFLDPLVDKLLVLAPLLALVDLNRLPGWGVFLLLARELTIAGWRATPEIAGAAVPGANWGGKVKTVVQVIAVALLLAPLPAPWPQVAVGTFWLAVVLTWASGIAYLWPRPGSHVSES